jgi:hypothetical protein
MNNGWIKLHRSILDNPICTKPDWAWLWVVMLLLANHQDSEIIWNGEKKIIKRGSFITSRQKLSVYSGIHESSVERALKYLKIEQQIEQQANKKFRLITIIKYSDYQEVEQVIEHQMNNKRTSNEQQLNTNKNDKNIKNDKNEENISKEIEQAPKVQYGNEEINNLLKALKETIGIDDFADSQKWQRIYAKHLLGLGKKIGKVEFGGRLQNLLNDSFKVKRKNEIRYVYEQLKSMPAIVSKKPNII